MDAQSQTNQLSLRQRLAQKYERHNMPFGATLELTNQCNLYCPYCYIERGEDQELSTAEWKSLLDDLADLGCFEVVFTGGEPLVRQDFFDIVRHARQRHFVLILFTNATLITEDVADKLQDLNLSTVEVSVYGTSETDERLTGVKGSFERSIQGIRRLRGRGIRTVFKVSWIKENYQDYEFLTALAEELGARFRGNVLINYRRDGSPDPQNYSLDDDQLYTLLKRASEREIRGLDEKKREIIIEDIKRAEPHIPGPCGAGRTGICVSATGEVYPCVGLNLKLGDLRATSIGKIWKGSETRQMLRSLTSDEFKDCKNCDVSHYCMLCPGDNLYEGRSITECNLESKRIARIMKQTDFNSLGISSFCPS